MEDFIGAYGNRLIIAVVGVGTALLLLAIVLWFIRRRSGSAPFIRGGRNRQPRLQVLDATAVDARRRLVLVRRDNVEHLVMIGGPTDIVIESGIGAIPFMKDIRDPQNDALISRDTQGNLPVDRQRSIPQAPQENMRTDARAAVTPAKVTAPQENRDDTGNVAPITPTSAEASSAARRTPPVTSTVASTPQRPVRKPQSAPVTSSVQPAPRHPQTPARENPATVSLQAPRAIAREPVTPATSNVPPIVSATLLQEVEETRQASPQTTPSPVPAQAPVIPPVMTATTPFPGEPKIAPDIAVDRREAAEVREPSIADESAFDFLDGTRERTSSPLPSAPPIAVASSDPVVPMTVKYEPLAPTANGQVFSDQLTSDFETFLEAEIAKTKGDSNTPEPTPAPAISVDTATPDPQPDSSLSGPQSAEAEKDAQKEMARIFGEISATRDR